MFYQSGIHGLCKSRYCCPSNSWFFVSQSHRSQRSPFDMLPRELVSDALDKDFWVRAEPPWDGSAVETDLFAGL